MLKPSGLKPITARQAGVVNCLHCRRLCHMHEQECPRCGAEVHSRITDSLSRTWALVLTGYMLLLPANLYPIMTIESFGIKDSQTIISGVGALIDEGMWVIALLVFFASIIVPIAKLLGLTYLLLVVQSGKIRHPRTCTLVYHVVEAIGRWSMLDMFVLAMLVALVNLGAVATVDAGTGATAFGAVVVVTMLAAASFDPRLIWDIARDNTHVRAT